MEQAERLPYSCYETQFASKLRGKWKKRNEHDNIAGWKIKKKKKYIKGNIHREMKLPLKNEKSSLYVIIMATIIQDPGKCRKEKEDEIKLYGY